MIAKGRPDRPRGSLVKEAPLKRTGKCPKCASTDIRVARRRTLGTMIPVSALLLKAVFTSWLVCASCGFVEAWIECEGDLEWVRVKLPRW